MIVGSGRNYPGAYHLVLGVEATQQGGQRASYSNYDPDGPVYSTEGIDGCNYEVQVAGSNIYSTLPDGNYGRLSGTSMATPLFAGAISALMMVKDYPSRDALYGDLIHLKADFSKIYSSTTSRKPMIALASLDIDDSNGNENGKVDVGETIKFYPILRNTWADATGISARLSVDPEFESKVSIEASDVALGTPLSAYQKAKATTPFKVKFLENIDNETNVKFYVTINCSESDEPVTQTAEIAVNNMVEISGLISEDRTLTADHVYLVNDNIGVIDSEQKVDQDH